MLEGVRQHESTLIEGTPIKSFKRIIEFLITTYCITTYTKPIETQNKSLRKTDTTHRYTLGALIKYYFN